MVPDGWKEEPLSVVLDRVIDYRGKSVPKGESGVPLITARNVRNGYLDSSEMEYVPSDAYRQWARRGIPQEGDVLFTTEAPLGNVCLFPDDGVYAIGQRIVALRVNRNILVPEFLVNFLLSPQGQDSIQLRGTGTTAKGIKSSELKKVLIAYPGLGEQRAISRVLGTWEKGIRVVQRLSDIAVRRKKALWQELLKGHGQSNPAKGWREAPISQIAERVQRRTDGATYPILTISSTQGFMRQDEKYSRYMAGESVQDYILLSKGEFAYNKGNSKTYQFGCVFPLEGYEKALVPHVYVCFKLKPNVNPRFYKHLFESDYLRPQLGRVVNTGVRNNGLLNITPSEFMAAKVPVPPLEEQRKIASVLDSAEQEVRVLGAYLESLKVEKRALMQVLLTGKRRVKVDKAA